MTAISNSDLMREIKEINTKLELYGHDISELKEWKIAVEAAKEALKEYQRTHTSQTKVEKKDESISNKALAAVIGTLVTLGVVIVALAK
jgi:hypothetical protein